MITEVEITEDKEMIEETGRKEMREEIVMIEETEEKEMIVGTEETEMREEIGMIEEIEMREEIVMREDLKDTEKTDMKKDKTEDQGEKMIETIVLKDIRMTETKEESTNKVHLSILR